MIQASSPRVNALDRIKPTRAKRSTKVSPTIELDALVKSLFLDGKGPQEAPQPSRSEEAEDEALLRWAQTGEEPQVTPEWVEVDMSDDP